MKLTATPFDPQTGELLPVYRDAYLRGDLARTSAQAVEAYLHRDAGQAHSTVTRWHELQADDAPAAPSWVQQQLVFIREQPQRFRRRALSLVTVSALLAGVSMAATNRPSNVLPVTKLAVPGTVPAVASLEAAVAPAAARTVLVHGRILNEKGLPLAGATVLRKGTAQGTSTDAQGNYSLRVPADGQATLQYGYGGYTEQEVAATQAKAGEAVTLQPRALKRRHWLFF
ncbi:carboxypeptidase-like regulatory domain-containing protein [Hymenobacter sp. BRD128]|uniref:carboxypeptidase-like regulatory domain-containing protein n=1 Tax=Hymenobacter sp. BRD128 TaxID=2675878 RepID=UPI00156673F6|nr:carboxypeptidase-like regulatory domain-containing protein [Hymenobacter sp. BRD128]QKG58035.1 carboxypeptidase-like regulatory domain-containing protein [Hymenobacter sp. BRD128]